MSSTIHLSAATVSQWKLDIENEAMSLDAIDILKGEEEEPTGDTSDDKKAFRQYRSRRSKLTGYIRKTLDVAQIESILRNVNINDPKAQFDALLAHYQPKTSSS